MLHFWRDGDYSLWNLTLSCFISSKNSTRSQTDYRNYPPPGWTKQTSVITSQPTVLETINDDLTPMDINTLQTSWDQHLYFLAIFGEANDNTDVPDVPSSELLLQKVKKDTLLF